MIVKNEENHLPSCLDSVTGLFDEIIIVDTGSSDDTKKIAEKYTDKIYDYEWIDDFGAARNFSFSKATSEYIMWLDADDVLPEKTLTELIKLKAEMSKDIDVVRLPYYYNTAVDDGRPLFTFFRERIVKNCEFAVWKGFIHETIAMFGKVISLRCPVVHHKHVEGNKNRNIMIYEKHIQAGDEFSPRDTFYYGRELYYHKRNHDAIEVFSKFISSKKGWIENVIDACRLRSVCYERLEEPENALMSLFEGLIYDAPRAESCCEIGRIFMKLEKYKNAIYWYKTALELEPNYSSGAFILPDCYGYVPAVQMCVCYSKLGDNKSAFKYNEIAAKFKMTESIEHNRKWFESIGITE
jgi:glycosyltransferase involved in cell wall biosynthesis